MQNLKNTALKKVQVTQLAASVPICEIFGAKIAFLRPHIKYFPNFASVIPKWGTERGYQIKLLNKIKLEPKKNLTA